MKELCYKYDTAPLRVEERDTPAGHQKAPVKLACFGETLSAISMEFPKGYTWAPHAHEHEQLTIVLEGHIQYTAGDVTEVLGPRDCFYIPSKALHTAVALEDCACIDVFTPVRMDQMAWYDDSIQAESAFIPVEEAITKF